MKSLILNKNIQIFKNNINILQNFLNTQRLLRGLDQIHIIDSDRKILLTKRIQKILKGKVKNKNITFLGVTFKPNTDDMSCLLYTSDAADE